MVSDFLTTILLSPYELISFHIILSNLRRSICGPRRTIRRAVLRNGSWRYDVPRILHAWGGCIRHAGVLRRSAGCRCGSTDGCQHVRCTGNARVCSTGHSSHFEFRHCRLVERIYIYIIYNRIFIDELYLLFTSPPVKTKRDLYPRTPQRTTMTSGCTALTMARLRRGPTTALGPHRRALHPPRVQSCQGRGTPRQCVKISC